MGHKAAPFNLSDERVRAKVDELQRSTALSKADQEYVRSTMFPWDTWLYESSCGPLRNGV